MAAMPTCIWLVRHGETEWSRDGRHTGTSDVALTPRGESDAAAIRIELAGVSPGLVLCSPLRRARDTAHLAGLEPDAFDPDLVEWDYGDWEGRTTAQIRQTLGDPTWVVWDHPIPSGASPGEQLADVMVRVDRVIERCLPVLAAGRHCVPVAHGHVLRILTARWLGLEPVAGRLFALDPATLSALGFEHEQQVIRCWNASDADRRD